jgi:hypothetical protein
MSASRTLVLAFKRERLNSFQSDLVNRQISSVDEPNARFSMTAKKIPNSVGACTQPCLTPLFDVEGVRP